MTEYAPAKTGKYLVLYIPQGMFPYFSNVTSTENSEVILNLTQDERAFRCCYRRRDIIVYKIVPVGTEKWTSYALNDSLFVNIFSSALQNIRKMFVC